ncbi:MAG: prephenate dehydratase [Candidatus Hydrogenedentota bacterium]|nr:MAG: prephenate dehydratase [Candidatus Hydrogenedentota bacterium]
MLEELRNKIDKIDENLIQLLSERARLAEEIGKVKQNHNAPLYRPAREQKIYERIKALNPGPLDDKHLLNIFREIMSAMISLEGRMKIAYLGPEGSFTHEAAVQKFGHSLHLVPCNDFNEVFEQVQKGKVYYGVLPIENSTEGIVNATLDGLVQYDLNIYAEILLSIEHNLISFAQSLDEIEEVYTHKQAYAQCNGWIRRNLPQAKFIPCSSTSEAVKLVSQKQNPKLAAIGSDIAARLYGIPVLERDIKDYERNTTRFIVISTQQAEKSGKDRTSVVFSLHDRPGALYATLQAIFENEINLTSIESRPSKTELWSYLFYLDFEGHQEDSKVKLALDSIREKAVFFRLLGSYPRDIR